MRLFTYTIRVDDGAAPNPFGGLCTLTICKPGIRRNAQVDDWIAGFGSKHAPSGDLSGRLVYAMRVTRVLSMEEYDRLALTCWPLKLPDFGSRDLTRRLGDCIYDFSTTRPRQRAGVHGPANATRDLGGKNALLSDHFFYVGNKAIPLPKKLRPILHQTQGHKCLANAPYVGAFLRWIDSLHLEPGQLYGRPDRVVSWVGPWGNTCESKCVRDRRNGAQSGRTTDNQCVR
jgi:hypothetical protein